MKSSLINMVVVLFTITLVASFGVGLVNNITTEPIAQAKAQAVKDAIAKVLPPFATTEHTDLTIDELQIGVNSAKDENGKIVGYAVESATKIGFSGLVRIMVGFTPDGTIYNINVLEQKETPGLGANMTKEGNNLINSFKDKKPALMTLKVKKDGGDVDALTAATISSRAYTDAVARALEAFETIAKQDLIDVHTGATNTSHENEVAEPNNQQN